MSCIILKRLHIRSFSMGYAKDNIQKSNPIQLSKLKEFTARFIKSIPMDISQCVVQKKIATNLQQVLILVLNKFTVILNKIDSRFIVKMAIILH